MFVLKQGWACLFGGLMLLGIIVSALIWSPDWALRRYDALFLYAPALQAALLILFAATVLIFGRTRIWFRIRQWHWMPLPVAAFLTSLFMWLAENIGTMTGTWLYSGQRVGDLVSFAKTGSWYLLLYVSFVTVTVAAREAIAAPAPDRRATDAPLYQARPDPGGKPV